MNYITFKEYSLKTGRSIASIYRDAEKGLIKTTIINGKKHIIIDKNINFLDLEDVQSNSNNSPVKEGVLVEDFNNIKYEVEIFKNTITTIEELANRIQLAKDETICNLKEEIEKSETNIGQLNDFLRGLSEENTSLRIEISQKHSQIINLEKKIEEIVSYDDKNSFAISQMSTDLSNKDKQIKELEASNHEHKLTIASLVHKENELTLKKDSLMLEVENSERKYQELKTEFENMRKILEDKDKELLQLNNQFFEMSCKHNSLQRDLSNKIDAQEDIVEKEGIIKSLTIENINYRDDKGKLEIKVEEKNVELKQNKHKIDLLQEQIQLLEKELKNHVEKKNFFSFTKKL